MTYPGGKGNLYRRIISLMPPHAVYIETHLGHGAVLRHKRPAGASFGFDLDPRVIAWWGDKTIPGCTISQGDGIEFLRGWQFTGKEIVYCDPPYLPYLRRKRRIYRFDCDEAQHLDILAVLKALPCPVIVSGYRSPLYDEQLAGWHRRDEPEWTQFGPVTDSLYLNYMPAALLHDYRFVGANFREREQIRRRRCRILRRIRSLPALERLGIIQELTDAEALSGISPPTVGCHR